jgi:hypothetical protein
MKIVQLASSSLRWDFARGSRATSSMVARATTWLPAAIQHIVLATLIRARRSRQRKCMLMAVVVSGWMASWVGVVCSRMARCVVVVVRGRMACWGRRLANVSTKQAVMVGGAQYRKQTSQQSGKPFIKLLTSKVLFLFSFWIILLKKYPEGQKIVYENQ